MGECAIASPLYYYFNGRKNKTMFTKKAVEGISEETLNREVRKAVEKATNDIEHRHALEIQKMESEHEIALK